MKKTTKAPRKPPYVPFTAATIGAKQLTACESNVIHKLYMALGLKLYAEGNAMILRRQRNIERTLADILAWKHVGDVDSILITPAGDVIRNLNRNRHDLLKLRYQIKYQTWLVMHGIFAEARDNITQLEWEIAPLNPFVLMRHDKISYVACLAFPLTKPLDNTTKRYGAAYEYLRTIRHASQAMLEAHFKRSNLDWNPDFLDMDPSHGLKEKHELFDEDVEVNQTVESYADVKKRVRTARFFSWDEFRHLNNAFAREEGTGEVWLRDTQDARSFLHDFLGHLLLIQETPRRTPGHFPMFSSTTTSSSSS